MKSWQWESALEPGLHCKSLIFSVRTQWLEEECHLLCSGAHLVRKEFAKCCWLLPQWVSRFSPIMWVWPLFSCIPEACSGQVTKKVNKFEYLGENCPFSPAEIEFSSVWFILSIISLKEKDRVLVKSAIFLVVSLNWKVKLWISQVSKNCLCKQSYVFPSKMY